MGKRKQIDEETKVQKVKRKKTDDETKENKPTRKPTGKPTGKRKKADDESKATATTKTKKEEKQAKKDEDAILLRNTQEANFMKCYYRCAVAYADLESKCSQPFPQEIMLNYVDKTYFKNIVQAFRVFGTQSLRIPNSFPYIRSLAKFFIIELEPSRAVLLNSWYLTKFVECPAFNEALVVYRDACLNGWQRFLTNSSFLRFYHGIFNRNDKNETFWYAYLNACKYDKSIDYEKSLLMNDPLINESVLDYTVFRLIATLNLPDALIILLTRPDLDVTSRSVEESVSSRMCHDIIKAHYNTKRTVCQELLKNQRLLQDIKVLQQVVLDFLL